MASTRPTQNPRAREPLTLMAIVVGKEGVPRDAVRPYRARAPPTAPTETAAAASIHRAQRRSAQPRGAVQR